MVPFNLQDIPSFNLQPHHFKWWVPNTDEENYLSIEAGKFEKHCIVDFICGNLFLLKKKKVSLKGGSLWGNFYAF